MINNKQLLENIEKLKEEGVDLFYNSSGDIDAYKLFVRHISYAVTLKYGNIQKGILTLEKELNLVDFETEQIIKIKSGEIIKILELKQLK